MSATAISRSPDLSRLVHEGYEVSIQAGHLVVSGIPYVNSEREIKVGALVSTLNAAGDVTRIPSDHVAYFMGEMPCDENGERLVKVIHDETARDLAPGLPIVCGFSSKPPEPDPDYFEKMHRYAEIISGPATLIDPTVTPRTFRVVDPSPTEVVYAYADTASGRAGIGDITARLVGQRIGIVGLGGTGAHVLDHVAKTPVDEIHVFDGDTFLQHNAFRSPGAADIGVLQQQLTKADYFARMYSPLRGGIVAHAEFIEESNVGTLDGLTFVFVCVDHGPSKRIVVDFLVAHDIPFIDVGMALWRNEQAIGGQVRTTFWSPDSRAGISDLSFGTENADDVYTSNIQISELNALNATHAVIRWKQHCGIYADFNGSATTIYAIDSNSLIGDGDGG